MRRVVTNLLSALKYLISAFMMYAGVATMVAETNTTVEPGFFYESRLMLVTIGIAFFVSGLTLFIGKLLKLYRIVGYGLFMVYSCFLFATIIGAVTLGVIDTIPNAVATLITGALYLRWKYHIYYYDHHLTRPTGGATVVPPLEPHGAIWREPT